MDHKLFANGDVFNIFVVTFPQSFSRNITIRLFQLSVFQKNIHELNWPKWSIFWPRVFFSAHLVKMAPLLRSKSLLCFVFLTKYYVTQYKSSSLKLHKNKSNNGHNTHRGNILIYFFLQRTPYLSMNCLLHFLEKKTKKKSEKKKE